jgi:hypothetical protein
LWSFFFLSLKNFASAGGAYAIMFSKNNSKPRPSSPSTGFVQGPSSWSRLSANVCIA